MTCAFVVKPDILLVEILVLWIWLLVKPKCISQRSGAHRCRRILPSRRRCPNLSSDMTRNNEQRMGRASLPYALLRSALLVRIASGIRIDNLLIAEVAQVDSDPHAAG
jgi:hypothetical protein